MNDDYRQRIISAIADFQKGAGCKAKRKAGSFAGKNRRSRNQRQHNPRIKNQGVEK